MTQGLNRILKLIPICWRLNIPPQIKSNKGKHSISFRGHFTCIGNIAFIEEGLNKKTRQRSLRRIEGQNPCPTSCFASVFLKQTVEFNRYPLNSIVCFKKTKDSVPHSNVTTFALSSNSILLL